MSDPIEVQLVATDRAVWSGQATLISFETADGSVGIMPGHSPLMAILRDGPVLIRQPEGGDLLVAVHTGFAVIDEGQAIILAESAELADEIDVEQAKALLAEAEASEESTSKDAALARAETRLKVAESR
jgi:F-type H+-transporting ATPase subunit epsilon